MKTYFAAFIPDGDAWSVLFADFELAAQGQTLEEAFAQAQDALRGRVHVMLADKEMLPVPSSLAQAQKKIRSWCEEENMTLPAGTLFQMIPCEAMEQKLIRVNVSFPESVLQRIDAKARLAGMTRSGFLATAAQAYAV